ncbi:hypothetical protein [Microvirga sp. 2MCAF38]|uniref:hypothetical protein n=1 Tax=Microvirga sp. 2MCAF38 TaxID=3232989 RepID=UPI003F979CBB
MASDLSWTILRPGLVIAPNAYGGTALLRGLASFPLVVPLLDGEQKIQTVSVDDVAEVVCAVVEERVRSRMTYDLVEDEAHSLRDVVLAFRSWLGYPHRILHADGPSDGQSRFDRACCRNCRPGGSSSNKSLGFRRSSRHHLADAGEAIAPTDLGIHFLEASMKALKTLFPG